MLALPVSRFRLSLAKFGVLVFCLLLEMVVFLLIFVPVSYTHLEAQRNGRGSEGRGS